MTAALDRKPPAWFDLTGTRIVVTGGNGGLGLAMAEALAQAGATVLITGRDQAKSDTAIAAARVAGLDITAYALDVRDSAAVEALAELLWSDGPIDVLVNNAGISNTSPSVDMPDDVWTDIIATNLTGGFWCCRSFGKRMLERGSGNIINLASNIGITGTEGWAPYSASKGAIITLTKTLAWEWAPKVRVNAIAPGAFVTDINAGIRSVDGVWEGIIAATPQGRWGTPAELGPLAVYMASDASAYMTGSIVSLDGGLKRS